MSSTEEQKPNPLLRIILKALSIYIVVSAIITAFFGLLIFKFVIGMGWLTAFLAVIGVIVAMGVLSRILPDEEPSLLDFFD